MSLTASARAIEGAPSWGQYLRTLNSYHLKSDPSVLVAVEKMPAASNGLRPYHTIDQMIAFAQYSSSPAGTNEKYEIGGIINELQQTSVMALHATEQQISITFVSPTLPGALVTHSFVVLSSSAVKELALSPYLKWNSTLSRDLKSITTNQDRKSILSRLVMITLRHSTDASDIRAEVISINETATKVSNLYDQIVGIPSTTCFSFDCTVSNRIRDLFKVHSVTSEMTEYRRFCDPLAYRAAGVVGGMLQSAQLYILAQKLALNWQDSVPSFQTQMQRITNLLHPDRGENELIRLVQRMQVDAGAVVPFMKQAPEGSRVTGPALLLPASSGVELFLSQLQSLLAGAQFSLSAGR